MSTQTYMNLNMVFRNMLNAYILSKIAYHLLIATQGIFDYLRNKCRTVEKSFVSSTTRYL